MDQKTIRFTDWHRWLLGSDPWSFTAEVVIRTVFILIFLMLAVRLMNNRMAGQITITELAVMITLGAIVSPIMQIPDRGIGYGVIGLAVAVLFQRVVSWLGVHGRSDEYWLQGRPSLLVEDGHLNLSVMRRNRISRQEIFAVLRQHNLLNLGDVKRMYLEPCGLFSIYHSEKEKNYGLSLTPSKDSRARDWNQAKEDGMQACLSCGHVQLTGNQPVHCVICRSDRWTTAITIQEEEKP